MAFTPIPPNVTIAALEGAIDEMLRTSSAPFPEHLRTIAVGAVYDLANNVRGGASQLVLSDNGAVFIDTAEINIAGDGAEEDSR